MSNEINVLKRFFDSKSIHISTYWLECCLDWFKENNRNYNETLMCKEILGQWLEADLRDIEYPSLPGNISSHKKHTLLGSYSVQIMYVKDISRSAYFQLKNIRNLFKLTRGEVDAETQTTGEGKRVLYLYLTDGVQHIKAFEYQQISCLNTSIAPGTKLLLVGPLLVRNGEILLKENNVQILGGQVEDLLVCNAYENILARELKMPQNPTPGGQFRIENEPIQHININNDIPHRNNQPLTYSNNINNDHIDDDDDIFNNINLSEHFNNFNDEQQQHQEENELFQDSIDINIEELEETEKRAIENTSYPDLRNQNLNSSFKELPINGHTEHFNNFNDEERLQYPEENELFQDSIDINIKELEETVKKATSDPDLIARNLNRSFKEIPINDQTEPFVYIKHLLDNRDNILNKTYKVKAQFFRVVEKLNLNKTKGWTMKFEIMDSTGTMIVDFLSNVIEQLMNISPNEAIAENLKVKNKVSKSHEKMTEALKNCKKKIDSFEYIMHLQFNHVDKPTVICLETLTEEHFIQLKNRVENTQLKIL